MISKGRYTEMKISRKNGPLFLQVKKIIKDRILNGIYQLGSNIPSEPQLEEEFKVSKITIRNAVKELVQEGFLEKGSGKGTKVISNTTKTKLSKAKRFTEILVENGHQMKKKTLAVNRIKMEKGFLAQHFGSYCYQIERIYLLDGNPYIYYIHYLIDLGPEKVHMIDLDNNSLYELIEEQGILLETIRDEFTVAVPPASVLETLKIEQNQTLLKRMRYSFDERDMLVEYSEGYYNTEMHQYVVKFDR